MTSTALPPIKLPPTKLTPTKLPPTGRPRATVKPKPISNKTYARVCNLVPSKDVEQDWNMADAIAAGALTATASLPASVDLRKPWWKIGDQEDTGSCVGWAAADGVMRYHLVMAQKLAEDQRVSPRYVWMASKETDEYTTRPETFIECGGTSLKAAIDVCVKFGVVNENLLPFHISTSMYSGDENAFWAAAAQMRAASYFNLGKNLAHWRTWLANHGPIMAGLSVDRSWDDAKATNGKIDTFQPGTERGGHAITIVGYRTDGRFIIRNSWGTSNWGDAGFGYATEAYINAAFFGESYGVTL